MRPHAALLAIATTVLASTPTRAAPAGPGDRDPDPIAHRIELHVRMSQAMWPADLKELRRDLQADPQKVITTLIEWLDVDERVDGGFAESQVYNTSGNALTLLEQLTDVRVCGLGRDWMGFSTHDHRGQAPEKDLVSGPWRAWLAVREETPTDQWFFGLSAVELAPLQKILRVAPDRWDRGVIDHTKKMGRRAWPYLLSMLGDDNYAVPDRRLCDQANELLARVTGLPRQPIDAVNPLTLPADHPDRASGHCVRRNRALQSLCAERWTAALLFVK